MALVVKKYESMFLRNSLLVSNVILSHDVGKQILQFILQNQELEEVEIVETMIVHKMGMRAFASRMWNSLKRHPSVTCVRIVNSKCLPWIAKTVKNTFAKNKKLVVFEIKECSVDIQTCQWIFKSFATNRYLRKLILSDNGICDNGIEIVCDTINAGSRLVHFDMSGNAFGRRGVEYLCKMLETENRVTEFVCENNQLGDIGATMMAQSLVCNSTLKMLNIAANGIGAMGIEAIAIMLGSNNTICSLSIADNMIDSRATMRLCDAIQKRKNIKFLDVSGVFESDGGNVVAFFKVPQTLVYLKMSRINLDNMILDMEMVKTIRGLLEVNTTIGYVGVAGNDMTLDMVYEFSKFLSVNTSVKTLDLSMNKIGLHDCTKRLDARFWDLVDSNKKLQSLILSDNGLCNKSMWYASDFLKTNTTLLTLDLSDNMIGTHTEYTYFETTPISVCALYTCTYENLFYVAQTTKWPFRRHVYVMGIVCLSMM
jgi:Ran GTPase-activating protein (RanGAP) involved in mRNA processing and transport